MLTAAIDRALRLLAFTATGFTATRRDGAEDKAMFGDKLLGFVAAGFR